MKIIILLFLMTLSLEPGYIDISEYILHDIEEISKTADHYKQDKLLIKYIKDISSGYAIDYKLICALIQIESKWNKDIRSSADAYGLMQIRKIAVKEIGLEYDRYNTYHNIFIGVSLLSKLITRYENVTDALVHYNAGTKEAFRRAGLRYAKAVLTEYNKIK